MTDPILSVRDLVVTYRSALRSGPAVNGVDFDLLRGEALALVGESGCGKSTVALSLLDLLPRQARRSGTIHFEGRDLLALPPRELRKIRGQSIGIIFQEPMTSLNPVYTVGDQVAEALREHLSLSRKAARARVVELLDQVGIAEPQRRIDAYPHELSGGQRQRVMIAMAIGLSPRLLIADEPTTALDTTTQAQILALLDRLRRELSMALLLISHDLTLVRRWTDRVLVMHHGKIMETLPATGIFSDSQHPYTHGLIAASVRLGDGRHANSARLTEIDISHDAQGQYAFALTTPPVPATPAAAATDATAILTVEGLRIHYPGAPAPAVDGVSLHLGRGETLGLVGESGSGKSSLARALLGLADSTGSLQLDGQALDYRVDKGQRRRIQMVFQDPYASLNPRITIADTLTSALALHGFKDIPQRVARVLDLVRLPQDAAQRYPHEFSGGQRQRIGIARALIVEPEVIVCDEPVSALDVSVQAKILNLLTDLKHELGLSLLFISHDLAVVQYVSDRVMVMRHGRIVESNDWRHIWTAPQHPYTRQLIEAAG